MRILRRYSEVPDAVHRAVLALGNFDGVHLGHQAVIKKAVEIARAQRRPSAVMTFEPHPRQVFSPHLPPLRIIPLAEKLRLISAMGVDYVWLIRFTKSFSHVPAKAFVEDMLVRDLRISHVVTGQDFVFGHNRTGNCQLLQQMSETLGFGYSRVEPVLIGGEACSSTRIRLGLAQGDVRFAAQMLGREYSITSRVQAGDHRGRKLGFPTANLYLPLLFSFAHGVYAVQAGILPKLDSNEKTVWVQGVANFGVRPTFEGSKEMLEVHCFDFDREIYDRAVKVQFVDFIREELPFPNVEALKAQIVEDCGKARAILATQQKRKAQA